MTLFRTVLRLTAVLASVVFFGATTGFAEDLGPAIGTKAPDIGARLDQTGKPRQLSDLMGRNGLVLMFFRSAEWCPFCQAQLVDINSGVAEIESGEPESIAPSGWLWIPGTRAEARVPE